jgi:hypothetical protein
LIGLDCGLLLGFEVDNKAVSGVKGQALQVPVKPVTPLTTPLFVIVLEKA